ncbi:hypothetical protein [Mucilaginibacter phyllosphaerae]
MDLFDFLLRESFKTKGMKKRLLNLGLIAMFPDISYGLANREGTSMRGSNILLSIISGAELFAVLLGLLYVFRLCRRVWKLYRSKGLTIRT